MPCRVDGPIIFFEEDEGQNTRAILCGVFTVLEQKNALLGVLDGVDWREVGVSKRTALVWWRKHKRADARRRQAEAEGEKRRSLAEQARRKLTPDELAALLDDA